MFAMRQERRSENHSRPFDQSESLSHVFGTVIFCSYRVECFRAECLL